MTVAVDKLGLREGVVPQPMPLGPPSIAALVESFEETDKTALIDRQGVLTYRQLVAAIKGAVARLGELNVQPGTVVAASAANGSELVIAFFAVQRVGAVWASLNAALAPLEKLAMLEDCGAACFLGDAAAVAEFEKLGAKIDRPLALICIDSWRNADAAEPGSGPPLPNPLAPSAIAYTSGTTGAPKGVVHSQHGLMTFANGCLSWESGQWIHGARRGVSITITVLNLMVYGPLVALTAGGSCVLMDRTDAEGVGRWIQDQHVEIFNGAPTTVRDLLYRAELQDLDLSSLAAVGVGGGPVPDDLFEAFSGRFGFDLLADYGLTESPASVISSGSDAADPTGVFMKSHPQLAIAILDEEGRPVPQGSLGELCVGPRADGEWAGVYTGMLGYWRKPDETRGTFHGRWLRTGDQARIDEQGRMAIEGRKKELILRGGANIFPAEIEAVVRRHPAIEDVVVLGLPDERLGEIVAAFIKLQTAGAQTSGLTSELRELCGEEIARYKIPARWFIVDDFPRNTLNKPVRALIRNLVQNELA